MKQSWRASVDADPQIIILQSTRMAKAKGGFLFTQLHKILRSFSEGVLTFNQLPMTLPYGVYILKCDNGHYYTGFTTNIKNRLKAHGKGEVHFTKDKLPIELVHLSLFANKQKAYDFEHYLKTGSGIAFRNKRLI